MKKVKETMYEFGTTVMLITEMEEAERMGIEPEKHDSKICLDILDIESIMLIDENKTQITLKTGSIVDTTESYQEVKDAWLFEKYK
jgi:hypothetical protein